MAAATAGALIIAHAGQAEALTRSPTFTLARAMAHNVLNVYVLKVAGVFMITTSTIAIRTGLAARWIAYLGYGLAALLLFGGGFTDWMFMVFPLWVLVLSGYILVVNLRRPPGTATGNET